MAEEHKDWRLRFLDHEGNRLLSTYSWEDPEEAPLMIKRIRRYPAEYNFIDINNEIVTGENIDWEAGIEVFPVNIFKK